MWRERERERGHSEVQIFEIIDSGKILHLIHVFVDTATARAQLPSGCLFIFKDVKAGSVNTRLPAQHLGFSQEAFRFTTFRLHGVNSIEVSSMPSSLN